MSSQRPGTTSSRSAMNTACWPRRTTATAGTRPRVTSGSGRENAGSVDRWPTAPLDGVGDHLPQAGVADPLDLVGRSQSGVDLTDGQRQSPRDGGRVGQGAAGGGPGLLAAQELLVAELGAEHGCGHGRLPGRSGRHTAATGPLWRSSATSHLPAGTPGAVALGSRTVLDRYAHDCERHADRPPDAPWGGRVAGVRGRL